ncbi:hypothetical protein ACHHYP_14567 [Achlya hypogyna]|uniref:Uncharacterized protein n=1 Tax=Achlya hypogyna TaxID=1202772 RepID=A0A1V9YCZ0_ACHHY|nr:hypothetical protein ACHHYP_14567 [Achlya hypogyna]
MPGTAAQAAFPWGDAGLVVRSAFGLRLVFRPGKGSGKTSVSFWEAKKMLETLGVAFDHAALLPSPLLQGTTVVQLTFFDRAPFEGAEATVRALPNHTVFSAGNAVEILLETQPSSATPPLAPTAPQFDKQMKGCRPDTVHVTGLPAKWFGVNTADFADLDAKLSHYNAPGHTLQTLFSIFGPVAHLEVVPPANMDSEAILTNVHFDVYVQFTTYDAVRSLLERMQGGRVLCHTAHPKVIVHLNAALDTTEYLSDAHIRQRRFAREQRQMQVAQDAAAAERAAKQKAAETAAATEATSALAARLQAAEDRTRTTSDDKTAGLVHLANESLTALRAAPSARLVDAADLALGGLESHLAALQVAQEAHALASVRKKWLKKVAQQCERSGRHLDAAAAAYEAKAASYASVQAHPAVVADLAAAKDALAQAQATIAHPVPVDAATEEDIHAYLDKLRDDMDEAECMQEAALARLGMLATYHAVQKEVAAADDPSVSAMLDALDRAWGDSTDTLLDKLRLVRAAVARCQRRHEIVARWTAASADLAADELTAPREAAEAALAALGDGATATDAAVEACGAAVDAFATAADAARTARTTAAAAEKALAESFASLHDAKMAAIARARKRLHDWQAEMGTKHGVHRSEAVTKRVHLPGRWPTVTSMGGTPERPAKLTRSSLFARQMPPALLVPSAVFAVQADGRLLSPRTIASERVAAEELQLRTQVIESQKRKEAMAYLQRLKEKELREQALKSIAARTDKADE